MKRLVTLFGVLILVGAIAAPVLAHDPGRGRGRHMTGYSGGGSDYCPQYGKGDGKLTEEQRGKLDSLNQKFYDEAAKLRNEIQAKSVELNTLLNSSTPDAEKARALQKEISDLRAKIDQARIDFQLETQKINPDARFSGGYGRGYGRHMKGYGQGMGSGHMGGYGQGMGYGHMGGGYGHHMGGYGQGMGYGRNMGGYGQGYCRN